MLHDEISSSPNCNLCDFIQIGTFLHIMWACPAVQIFWQQIVKNLSDALGLEIDFSPKCMLLNDDETLTICKGFCGYVHVQ